MIFLKFILLLVYLVALLAVYRIVDYIACSEAAGVATLVDPLALTLQELRWILHARGITYHHAIEKKDLRELVQATGIVSNEEVSAAKDMDSDSSTKTVYFTNAEDFDEAIDKSEDVWLVQIVAESSEPIMQDSEWKKLKKRAFAAGIHTGKITCKDNRICHSRSFFSPQLLLSYHYQKDSKGIHQKYYITKPADCNHVFHWISNALQSTVEEVPNLLSLKRSWLSTHTKRSYPVQIVYVSRLSQVPVNFAVLKIKFKDSVRFGKMITTNDMKDLQTFTNHDSLPESFMYVITSEGLSVYGDSKLKGNLMHFNDLHLFVRFLNFDINLLFTWSIYICNLLATLSFFTGNSNLLTRLVAFVKSFVTYNAVVLCVWLFLSSYNVKSFSPFTNYLLANIRAMVTTDYAGILRTDLIKLLQAPYLVAAGFVLFYTLALFVMRKLGIVDNEPEAETLADILLLNNNHSPSDNDISQRWVERLATPGLWLQPLVPCDYIEDLPVWGYSGKCILNSDDSEGDEHAICTGRRASPSPSRLWPRSCSPVPRGRPCFMETTRQSSLRLRRGILRSLKSCFRGRSPKVKQTPGPPSGMREESCCSICLENYTQQSLVCGLPCHHVFHHECILSWLHGDRHCCPICRWPSYQAKYS
ncbi:E3 ubiquitin-protein ligase RNF103-like [Clavelina lepadiformis]|uniref:RING-type domain-containing protein n=1 Tax=Clavelina lepadiformis TaxID=159417 RepID=A0ABP0GKG2_CLALP